MAVQQRQKVGGGRETAPSMSTIGLPRETFRVFGMGLAKGEKRFPYSPVETGGRLPFDQERQMGGTKGISPTVVAQIQDRFFESLRSNHMEDIVDDAFERFRVGLASEGTNDPFP
ncbi:MAG: hypothetical protein HY823_08840 [Acidobacteria bacterium]|nr:hypothetical protein [Acidobacteriota bacterium]